MLHPNVYVGNDADLRGSIVGRATEIRRGARVLEGSVIADGCTIMDGAVIGTDVMIYPGKTIDEGTVVDESVVWESPAQRQVFSDSGVRGIVNVDMTPERIVRLAAAFATTLPKGATVSVGRDHSRAARALNRALAGALTAAGINLRDLRAVTTALVRNDTARYSDGGVVLRTTPGRPDSIDVLFLNSHGGEISSHQREAIERIFTRKEFRRPLPSDIGDIRTPHRVLDDYANDVESEITMDAIRRAHPRIVLDAGGGPSVGVLSMIMGRLGLDALTVGAAMEEEAAADQAPYREAALRRLSGLVVSSGARIGARLGPTGERLSIVDELGRVIDDGRMLLIMLDLMAASRHSGCVAVPVTTSRLAEEVAAYHGTSVRRIGNGSAALAAAATEPDVILAGDGRGRFVLPALGPGPDAISALMMLLSLMADTDLSLSQLNGRIPATSVIARTVTVPWHRRAGAMRAVRLHAEGTEVDTLDGIRVVHEDGSWCLVLPEDDQACLTLYAEAADAGDRRAAPRPLAEGRRDRLMTTPVTAPGRRDRRGRAGELPRPGRGRRLRRRRRRGRTVLGDGCATGPRSSCSSRSGRWWRRGHQHADLRRGPAAAPGTPWPSALPHCRRPSTIVRLPSTSSPPPSTACRRTCSRRETSQRQQRDRRTGSAGGDDRAVRPWAHGHHRRCAGRGGGFAQPGAGPRHPGHRQRPVEHGRVRRRGERAATHRRDGHPRGGGGDPGQLPAADPAVHRDGRGHDHER